MSASCRDGSVAGHGVAQYLTQHFFLPAETTLTPHNLLARLLVSSGAPGEKKSFFFSGQGSDIQRGRGSDAFEAGAKSPGEGAAGGAPSCFLQGRSRGSCGRSDPASLLSALRWWRGLLLRAVSSKLLPCW